MLKKAILLFLILCLTSCASLNSKFDCPMKPGINCESLDQINARVDRGEIGHDEPCTRCIKVSSGSCQKCQSGSQSLRYKETVRRVWIAPFENTAGNYHEASEVFTVAKHSHWRGSPVTTITAEEV
jgi:conjugal transfer pilus assembly protein TraV